jgi:drug/metabolite transporter (DMT)-like permease
MLLKVNPVSRIAVFGFMTPIFGVLFSAAMLGEVEQAFNLQTISSLVLVCAGIFVVNKLSAVWDARMAAKKGA